jgi:biotin-(acetyl-CoA carboxylase) ligase
MEGERQACVGECQLARRGIEDGVERGAKAAGGRGRCNRRWFSRERMLAVSAPVLWMPRSVPMTSAPYMVAGSPLPTTSPR